MRIQFLATGSTGNSYLVTEGAATLLLDAGIALRFLLQKLGGARLPQHCLITHEHKDHSRAAKDLQKLGTTIYSAPKTLSILGLKTLGVPLEHNKAVFVDNDRWRILPLNAIHDAEQPLMFVIASMQTNNALLYATDTADIPYHIRGLTHLLVEINYDFERVLDDANMRRLLNTHMSLQKLSSFLLRMDMTRLKEIHLCHCSGRNLDEKRAMSEVEKISGCPVYSWNTYHKERKILL